MGRVVAREDLPALAAELRAGGRTTVFTNGYFDLMHVGHARYLAAARALGDQLVVAVNADATARRAKDPRRPIQTEGDRVELVAALACVDYAVLFDEDTADRLLLLLQPAVYVKGGDYASDTGKVLPEAPTVASYGGRVVVVPLEPGRSTTGIIDTIVERYCSPS